MQQRLDRRWSPEQISQALRSAFPEEPERHLAHETIYQAIYLPHRGGLERTSGALRTGRPTRRRRRRAERCATRFIDPGTPISHRPAEVADRQVAGHWEGDLIVGRGNRSAIGSLVDRTTRYVKLLHLPESCTSEHVRDALVHAFAALPTDLARSLTWDQGSELARHDEFTRTTGIPVHFCEPAGPWQRGSNENTNGLLRQYFPKSTELSIFSAEDLAFVAAELDSRPRRAPQLANPLGPLR
ncbi:IS30 family transposase [Streptomyces olivochromogenes]|uniref:IS30 family transposase n=1 Tax=Streptomyces olivochromogenes TaxID=1963 RepID=UPI0036DBA97C